MQTNKDLFQEMVEKEIDKKCAEQGITREDLEIEMAELREEEYRAIDDQFWAEEAGKHCSSGDPLTVMNIW